MFSLVRGRLSYANVVATLALFLAMSGGALAAGHYLISSTKQISPKVLKALKGAHGPAGPAGPAGTSGSQGPQGPAGANGKEGPGGKEGVSVTSSVEPKGTNCKEGGSKFVSASTTTYACSGEKGKEGPAGKEGSPWTAGGTLPTGQTETGTWAVMGVPAKGTEVVAWGTVSFPIPLAAPLAGQPGAPGPVYIGPEEGEGEGKQSSLIPSVCKGTFEKPGAVSGHLCIFAKEAEDLIALRIVSLAQAELEANTVGPTGAGYAAFAKEVGTVNANGTWAVTAE